MQCILKHYDLYDYPHGHTDRISAKLLELVSNQEILFVSDQRNLFLGSYDGMACSQLTNWHRMWWQEVGQASVE